MYHHMGSLYVEPNGSMCVYMYRERLYTVLPLLQVDAMLLIRMRRSRKISLVAGEFYAMQARGARERLNVRTRP
jgi:hypothetical protein